MFDLLKIIKTHHQTINYTNNKLDGIIDEPNDYTNVAYYIDFVLINI